MKGRHYAILLVGLGICFALLWVSRSLRQRIERRGPAAVPAGASVPGTDAATPATGAPRSPAEPIDALPEDHVEESRRSVGGAGDPLALLTVLSKDSGTPLAGAIVVLEGLRERRSTHSADEHGIVRLPAGDWHLAVSAPGHARRTFLGRLEPAEHVVHLEPGGSIEVLVRTSEGTPLEGARLTLIPPLEEERLNVWPHRRRGVEAVQYRLLREAPHPRIEFGAASHRSKATGATSTDERFLQAVEPDAWRGRTDADGRLAWTALPPASGYRVRWDGNRDAFLDPPAESAEIRLPDGRLQLRMGPGMEELWTAPLSVRADEGTFVRVVKVPDGVVRGVLDRGKGGVHDWAIVNLAHLRDFGEPPALQPTLKNAIGPDGSFRIEGVAPGKKQLTAQWRTDRNELRFASVDFTLTPGSEHDLGTIRPERGSDVVIRPVFVDDSGFELEVADVLTSTRGSVELRVQHYHLLSYSVTAGSDWTLEGVPPGVWNLGVELGMDAQVRPGLRVRGESRSLVVPGESRVDLRLEVQRLVSQAVRARLEADGPRERVAAYINPLEPVGPIERQPLTLRRASDEAGAFEATLSLRPGRYDVLLHAHPSGSPPRDGPGWYWRGVVTVTDGSQPVAVAPLLGCELRGVARSTSGDPRPGQRVAVGLGGFGNVAPPAWTVTHFTQADSEGRYRITSLPPHTALVGNFRANGIHTGAAGTVLDADLVFER